MSAYQQGNRTAGVVAVLLLLGLFVATGVLAHLSPSPIRTPPSVLPSMERSGPGEYTIWFVHPAWGLVRLVTDQNSEDGLDPGPASLTVKDASGTVRFSWEHEFLYSFGPAGTTPLSSPRDQVGSPVDRLGHIFLSFNPGRSNGVIVLVPTATGFQDLATLPPHDDYQTRFYCANAADPDHDHVYEVIKPKSCGCTAVCDPDARKYTYRWRGSDYVED